MIKIKSICISIFVLIVVISGCSIGGDREQLKNEISELKRRKSEVVQSNNELKDLSAKNQQVKSLINDIDTKQREFENAKNSLEREAGNVLR